MTQRDDGAFERFLNDRVKDLRRISGATRGESSLGDVQSEAWLMLMDMQSKGITINLGDPQHQKLLLSHLYQHLVRYTELNVRNAVRLDHSPSGEADEMHPLAHLLAAAPEYDPVNALAEAEEQARTAIAEPSAHHSLASAWVALLRMFDNRMTEVAKHLMISLSYCYVRCTYAKVLAVYQWPLPTAPYGPAFVPKPWRRYRIMRPHMQMALDFGEDGALPGVVGRSSLAALD
jgi:hypothetical protein